MALSKAEASVGSLEAVWVRCARVEIIALLGLFVVGICLIILALREEVVYKKFIRGQFIA
jgi:hypothetical protein